MGAMICGNPLWLATALAKIQSARAADAQPDGRAVPATAHMFIINPLTGRGVDNWFSTHPNTENRIAELVTMAREAGITAGTSTASLEHGEVDPRYRKEDGGAGPWSAPGDTDRRRGPWG